MKRTPHSNHITSGSLFNRRWKSFVVLLAFLANSLGPVPVAQADTALGGADAFHLPAPGVMVRLSPPLDPPMLKGIKVHPDNPFRFDFILDIGDGSKPSSNGRVVNPPLREESMRLIKYFLASLTIPEKDLWVNLSPYEKNRIIPQSFGLTEMGRDLLAEDYMLKQITASLIYPEDEIGKKFWKRIYQEAAKRFGTTNIPVNTFNKVWIVPDKAVVYENPQAGTAYVVEAKLKVMLEQDYLSLAKHINVGVGSKPTQERAGLEPAPTDVNKIGSQIIREIVIPELTREVNEDKNFTQLRQVYNSLILATWYKRKIRDSILEQVYADKKKVAGVGYKDKNDTNFIYRRYLQAFKKGAYNYIKEEIDPVTQETIPRKYFSGGEALMTIPLDYAMSSQVPETGKEMRVEVNIMGVSADQVQTSQRTEDQAMLGREIDDILAKADKYGGKALLEYGEDEVKTRGPVRWTRLDKIWTILKKTLKKKTEKMMIMDRLKNLGMKNGADFFEITPKNLKEILSDEWQAQHGRTVKAYLMDGDLTLNDHTTIGQMAHIIGLSLEQATFIEKAGSATVRELAIAQEMSFETRKTFEIRDPLTGLLGRSALQQSFIELMRKREDHKVAIIIDADHFKRINDTYGHPVGDAVLKAIGEVLEQQIRVDSGDKVFRFGGEEFVILMPFAEPLTNLRIVIDRIRQKIEDEVFKRVPVLKEDKDIITASFGALFVEASINSQLRNDPHKRRIIDQWITDFWNEEVLPKADAQLYSAKKNGRNRVEIGELQMDMMEYFERRSESGQESRGQEAGAASKAMTVEKNGGIDLTPARMDLQTKVMDSRLRGNDNVGGGNDMQGVGNGGGIRFHLDPAMLEQLRDAPGFVPVIINIRPVADIRLFLGIKEPQTSTVT